MTTSGNPVLQPESRKAPATGNFVVLDDLDGMTPRFTVQTLARLRSARPLLTGALRSFARICHMR